MNWSMLFWAGPEADFEQGVSKSLDPLSPWWLQPASEISKLVCRVEALLLLVIFTGKLSGFFAGSVLHLHIIQQVRKVFGNLKN